MRIPTSVGSLADDAGRAVQLLAVGEPRRHLGDELGVEGAVLPGRRGEIPAVDEVVGGQLANVLLGVLVAVGEVHRRDAGEFLVDRRYRLG